MTSSYIDHYKGKRKQDLTTPKDFFEELNKTYKFTMDGAASPENALLSHFSSAENPRSWKGERVFCNPPWNNVLFFIEQAVTSDFAILLVPARVNSRWFHKAIDLGFDIQFFTGKLRFGNSQANSPVDCLLLLWEKTNDSCSVPSTII